MICSRFIFLVLLSALFVGKLECGITVEQTPNMCYDCVNCAQMGTWPKMECEADDACVYEKLGHIDIRYCMKATACTSAEGSYYSRDCCTNDLSSNDVDDNDYTPCNSAADLKKYFTTIAICLFIFFLQC